MSLSITSLSLLISLFRMELMFLVLVTSLWFCSRNTSNIVGSFWSRSTYFVQMGTDSQADQKKCMIPGAAGSSAC